MSELESAEAFANRVVLLSEDGAEVAAIVDALPDRDAAVRVALLDELDAEAERNGAQDSGDNYTESIARLRAKYQTKEESDG